MAAVAIPIQMTTIGQLLRQGEGERKQFEPFKGKSVIGPASYPACPVAGKLISLEDHKMRNGDTGSRNALNGIDLFSP